MTATLRNAAGSSGSSTGWNFTVDTVPPLAGLSFKVSWSDQDATSGLSGYDVHYQQNGGSTWTNWLTQTNQSSAVFAGSSGYTYTFRVQGRDGAGNMSQWVTATNTVLVNTVTKYYSFGAQRVAMRRGSVVRMRISTVTIWGQLL